MINNRARALLLLALVLLAGSASARKSTDSSPPESPSSERPSGMPVNVYIAPFTSRSNIDSELLASFRDLFEETFEKAFVNDGVYKVLNRQTIEKILAEAQNEAGLTSVDELNSRAKTHLRIAKAEGVVFGEVTDDKDSGEVIVAAKLQSFDSVLYWNKSVSIKRGLIHDRASRKAAIEQLVKAIEASVNAKSGMGLAQLDADVTLQPKGSPSISVHLVITPDSDKATYTARVANGPTFTGGILTDDGRVFTFGSLQSGGMYALDGKPYRPLAGQLKLTMSPTLDTSDETRASGNLSGAFTLTSSPAFSKGPEETQTGQVVGTYIEKFAPKMPIEQLPLPVKLPTPEPAPPPKPKLRLVQLMVIGTFQPTGLPSSQVAIQITPNAGNATYTATVGRATFADGASADQGKTFEFKSVQPGGFFMSGTTFLVLSEGSLSLTLSETANLSSMTTGSVTGTLRVKGAAGRSGTKTDLAGQIIGTYHETLAADVGVGSSDSSRATHP